ncbi:MAG: hypothetical protein GQF41_2574 [Candidatus Rifleibacterium amylolyticum]|nr:MAG: hypothetical protein GQF41_2574 [Candidatus Rifleibacterium amylolyticum]
MLLCWISNYFLPQKSNFERSPATVVPFWCETALILHLRT